jgi:hypothetical protein
MYYSRNLFLIGRYIYIQDKKSGFAMAENTFFFRKDTKA